MARRYGRALRGQRLRASVPHGHWKTTTFVAGLRLTGLVAPFVLDGPINRDAFEVYLEKVLVPELRPGDVVVMDNLSSHKGPSVRALIKAAAEPPHEATHWTAAAMAKAVGISLSSVQRIWKAHGLQPHRIRRFKLSNDPEFVPKLRDV